MDIPSESMWFITMLIVLGVVVAIIAFLAPEIFRNLDFLTGFFR